MKIVLQRDGSISIVPVKDIKETLIEVKECTLEQFEANFPSFTNVLDKFRIVSQSKDRDSYLIKEYASLFYETIRNTKRQESFSKTEIDELIKCGIRNRQGL